jgi:ReqiPepy6 Gp37-like protein
MDIYVLDALRRRTRIVDKYVSFVWAERWRAWGDFELVMDSTQDAKTLFKTGVQITHPDTHYVGEVETIEDKEDDEGRKILTIKGRTLEKILEDRVAKESTSDLTTSPKWTITGLPAVVARKIFHDICVVGVLDPDDVIDAVVEGSFMPDDTIPEPTDTITVEIEPVDVYTALKNISDVWDLGFRLVRQTDSPALYFDIYTGTNRTSAQDDVPPVIFSPELDNLQNMTELSSTATAKNVAYVFSPAGFLKVYATGVDPEVDNFERRVLVVNASDITDENPNVPLALQQRGMEELSKNRALLAFDGEINQSSEYKYGRDYFLGDIVEQRNGTGSSNYMRVEEQIFSSDQEGDKSYPTLALNQFVNAGSWAAMGLIEWDDMGTEEWNDMP